MTREKRLSAVLGVNVALIAALTLVGLSAHSLGLLAAGADYLADAGAIGLTLLAQRLARTSTTGPRGIWFTRAPTLAAIINCALILVVAVIVGIEAVFRIAHGTQTLHGAPTFVVALIAFLTMGGCALILIGDDDLSVRSVLLDTALDAAAAGGVAMVGAITVLTGGVTWLDPAVAIAISAVVLYHAGRLLIEARAAL